MLQAIETKPTIDPPRIVLHGGGGVGKTTFAAGIPGVVFIPAEEGAGTLEFARFPRPTSYEDILNNIAALLQEDHEYKACAIDTVDHVEPLIWEAVCRDRSTSNRTYDHIEDFGYAKGYTYADVYWTCILRSLDALRREKRMVTILLAHTESKTLEDPVHGAYDKWVTKVHKRANALIHEWADIVGFAEIERTPQVKEGKRDVKTVKTTGRRVLCLEDSGGFIAKNRYGLPPRIELDYSALRAEIAKSFGVAGEKVNESESNEKAA
jgi:hypothetical protein